MSWIDPPCLAIFSLLFIDILFVHGIRKMRDVDISNDELHANRFKFKIRKIPGDGDCFFAAIGSQIGIDARTLRKITVELFKRRNANEKHLMATADGMSETGYIHCLSNGMFGGHNEMVMLSKHYNLVIYVYSRTPKGLKKLTKVSQPTTTRDPKRVFILWDGVGHYDALVHV